MPLPTTTQPRPVGSRFDIPVNRFTDRIEPALQWRVISITSWGASLLYQSNSMLQARAFYNNYRVMGFNTRVELQHWSGINRSWKTEAVRSGDYYYSSLGADKVDITGPGLLAVGILAIIGISMLN